MEHKRGNLIFDCFLSVGSSFPDDTPYLCEYGLHLFGEAGNIFVDRACGRGVCCHSELPM